MSADNWAICPKCNPGKHIDEAEHSLREDYEQGMDSDGVYFISYRASCDCGFRWSYQRTINALKSPSIDENTY